MDTITITSIIAAIISVLSVILSYRKINLQRKQEKELLMQLENKSNKYLKELSKYLEDGGKLSSIDEIEGSLTKQELIVRNKLFEKYILNIINNKNKNFSEVRDALYGEQKINNNYLEKIHKNLTNSIRIRNELNSIKIDKLIFELEEQKLINKNLQQRLLETQNTRKRKSNKINIRHRDEIIVVSTDEIVFIMAENDGCRLHYKSKNLWTYISLKELTNQLPEDKFVRIFRSTIVNIDHIDWINHSTLKVSSGDELKIGRSYKNDIKLKVNRR